MAHLHSVYDNDKHFSINPPTRELVNQTPGKTSLMQFDHDSERITFDLPKTVEGHDMMTCNVIEVHYLNIDAQTKAQNADVYGVDDLQVSPSDDEVVCCSWLVSQNATQLVGPLHFRLTFKCVTDEVDYRWSTAIYKGLTVSDGIDNGEHVVEEFSDILEAWRNDLEAAEGAANDAAAAAGTAAAGANSAAAAANTAAIAATEAAAAANDAAEQIGGVDNHFANKNNPHGVTAEQVGALGQNATAANSSKLGGQLPEYYATAEAVQVAQTTATAAMPKSAYVLDGTTLTITF